MDRIDFGSIIILSACGMNETFFFSIKFTQQIQKELLDFSFVERTDYFMERSDSRLERSDLEQCQQNDRLPSCPQQTTDEQIKIFVTENTESDTFVWKSIRKNTPLSSEIHCYVKNRKGLHLVSNLNSVRFLLKGQLQNQFVNEGRCICRLSIRAQAIQVE